jgi:hypothetical protein
MFFVLRHHFAPRHFCPEVGQKNLESRRKKMEFGKILFETFFCTGQHGKTMQDHTKFIRLGVVFWAEAVMRGIERKKKRLQVG